jgi:hypothetical protein
MSKSSKIYTRTRRRKKQKYTRKEKKCVYTDEAKRIIKEINTLRKYNK